MKKRAFSTLSLLLFIGSAAIGQSLIPSSQIPGGSSPDNGPHTTISLVADVKSIQPGSQFSLGLVMKMQKGWHTYWKNSGEAGLPTQIRWTLSEGITAGEIRWPLPHKYDENGEVLTYGYETENMLLVDFTTTQALAAGSTVTLKADVNWLECEYLCIPGSGVVELMLPVLTEKPKRANEALFNGYKAQIPQPYSSLKDLAVATAARDGAVEIKISARTGKRFVVMNDVSPDFYPELFEEVANGRTEVVASSSEATLKIPLSSYEKLRTALVFRGVLVYQMESGTRTSVELEVPLSAEFCANLPIVGGGSGSLLDQKFEGFSNETRTLPFARYIVFALIGGLLLNIMPCVLPVIALKIFGLVRMAGDQPRQVKRLGIFFSLGILASFLVLAALVILLKGAGEQVGWGFQFQEPLFVIAMSALIFAFGLNLFGVFEIGLPTIVAFAGIGSAIEGRDKAGKGYTASFAEGVFATILATPCTAPFLGTALGFAFTQPAWVTLTIFASVAVGMALPYLVLTSKPAWMKFLPKPGEWMVTTKELMGFLLMATVLWLLYVLGHQLGVESIIWTGAFLIAVGVACWLVGRFATLNASRQRYVTTWIVAVAVVVAGYWVFLETILDVRTAIAGISSNGQSVVKENRNGIQWQAFSLPKLEEHLQDGRTVFIDFTADWCLTCKVNEHTVMTDEKVVEEFRKSNTVAIRADWTNRNPDITRLLAKFGRSGVPLYVIFPAGRPTEPIVLPEVITTGILIDAIGRARSLRSASLGG